MNNDFIEKSTLFSIVIFYKTENAFILWKAPELSHKRSRPHAQSYEQYPYIEVQSLHRRPLQFAFG